jgi:glutathionyl-hydroquinone reductase
VIKLEENIVYTKMLKQFDEVYEMLRKYYMKKLKNQITETIENVTKEIDAARYVINSNECETVNEHMIESVRIVLNGLSYLKGKVGFKDFNRIEELNEEMEITIVELKMTA